MLDLKTFYKKNQFKFDDKMAYGIYRNRVVSIVSNFNNIIVTISFNSQLSREDGEKLVGRIREKVKLKYRAVLNAIVSNVNTMLIFYQSSDLEEMFLLALDECINIFEQLNLPSCEICPICGRALPTNSPFLRIRESAIQAHSECIQTLVNSNKSINNQLEENGKKNYMKSFLIVLLVFIVYLAIFAIFSMSNLFIYFNFIFGSLFYFTSKVVLKKKKINFEKRQIITTSICAYLVQFLGTIFFAFLQLHYIYVDKSISELFLNFFSLLKGIGNYSSVLSLVLIDIFFAISLITLNLIKDLLSIKKRNNSIKTLK